MQILQDLQRFESSVFFEVWAEAHVICCVAGTVISTAG